MNWEVLDVSILLPAFLAGLLVLSTHVPLGQQVLDRGIIFIDLAVAQVAGLGVIVADALGWHADGLAAQVAAVVAALLAAVILLLMERYRPQVQEALIGVMFVLAATASILVLAGNPQAGEHLKDLLVGQILWVTLDQLWPILAVYLVVLALWFGIAHRAGRFWFYGLFAVAVTASVQLVGVYLVFASLIIPALATRRLRGGRRLAAAYGVGILGYSLGLVASALLDLPTGAVIVWSLAAVAVLLSPLTGKSATEHTAR